MRRWSLLVLFGAAAAALPAAAVPEGGGDALGHNRELLEKWRADPDHYARLQRDLRAFWALPPARRRQMRQLDQDLHQAEPRARKRLWAVLERYHAWLVALPEADRQRVEAAAGAERLRVVREIRERQWVERLPKKVREELLQLPPERRPAQIALLRKEEQRHRREWRRGLRLPPPVRPTTLAAFPAEFQAFVQNVLAPQLSAREKEGLKGAEKKWPQYVRVLDKLSRDHPALPPLRQVGPVVRYEQLPAAVQRDFPRAQLQKDPALAQRLAQANGKWPDFALEFARAWKLAKRVHLPPLGASRPKELPSAVQTFLDKKLTPALSPAEAQALTRLEGRWPDYPLKLLELARAHRLSVPGLSLPWPDEVWDSLAER